MPRWLAETVVRAAQATNVDPAYLMALADKESSLLPDNKARTSSAEGLFQFIETTWLEVLRRYGPKHGYAAEAEAIQIVQGRPVVSDAKQREAILSLRRDPYLSALMAGEMITTHREILAGKTARDPSFAELYMAHFLGVQGARRFVELLSDKPGKRASGAFPRAAKANRPLFFVPEGRGAQAKSSDRCRSARTVGHDDCPACDQIRQHSPWPRARCDAHAVTALACAAALPRLRCLLQDRASDSCVRSQAHARTGAAIEAARE